MEIEKKRYEIQQALDASKNATQRNELGQFSTPYELACDIVDSALNYFPDRDSLQMIEPACGTGVFFSALGRALGMDHIAGSVGFEIDPVYQQPSVELWSGQGVDIRLANFLTQTPDRHFPLLITNPPYSRHHHIPPAEKTYLQQAVKKATGLTISGLAGLYCYFIMLSSEWLEPDGISCWLVPSEFMDVNYGNALKQYLLENVDLLRIHRFDENDLQFADALVTSSVIFFKKSPPSGNPVEFSFSGSVSMPMLSHMIDRSRLLHEEKWNHLFINDDSQDNEVYEMIGDFFDVRRGIATGCNNFFIIGLDTVKRFDIPNEYLTPILPGPKKIKGNRIESVDGLPLVDNPLFLFSSNEDIETIRQKHKGVAEYIEYGIRNKVDQGYICSRHNPWYSCENRKPAPFVIPYMGRGSTDKHMFRFILNESDAIATNGYLLMYPKEEYSYLFKNRKLLKDVWEQLNKIPMQSFERQGRFYGGGLHKIEPRELLRLPAKDIAKLLGNNIQWVA